MKILPVNLNQNTSNNVYPFDKTTKTPALTRDSFELKNNVSPSFSSKKLVTPMEPIAFILSVIKSTEVKTKNPEAYCNTLNGIIGDCLAVLKFHKASLKDASTPDRNFWPAEVDTVLDPFLKVTSYNNITKKAFMTALNDLKRGCKAYKGPRLSEEIYAKISSAPKTKNENPQNWPPEIIELSRKINTYKDSLGI